MEMNQVGMLPSPLKKIIGHPFFLLGQIWGIKLLLRCNYKCLLESSFCLNSGGKEQINFQVTFFICLLAGAWKSRKGIWSLWRCNCAKKVLRPWNRWTHCSSWSRDHRLSSGTFVTASLDDRRRTGPVCRKDSEDRVHRTPKLLPHVGHVISIPYYVHLLMSCIILRS